MDISHCFKKDSVICRE